MTQKPGGGRTVKAVNTTFAIIEAIDELDEACVSDIADYLSIAKSTAHKHLKTLEQNEYVVFDEGEYTFGLKFLKYGQIARRKKEISEVSQPAIEQLAKDTNEAVWVAIEEHGHTVYTNKALGERAVPSRAAIGERIGFHSAAVGKALLAHLPEERIDYILEMHGLPKRTERTITDLEELREELERVRAEGAAFNDGESRKGVRAVASAVIHEGDVKGAVVLASTANRLKGDYFREEIPDLVRGTANEIELKLAFS